MNNKILSIIIPTKNRRQYLESCLDYLLKISDNRIEIIVNDNSLGDIESIQLAQTIRDSRVKYLQITEPISAIQNILNALRRATGYYALCIGDDDSVAVNILDICEAAKAQNCEALIDNWPAYYHWPDFQSASGSSVIPGSISVRRVTGVVQRVNALKELDLHITTGGVGLQLMPRIYLGIVRNETLQLALSETAAAEPGTCTDMYTSVVLSHYVKTVHVVDYPIVIPGTSKAGAGQALEQRKHEGEIEGSPHVQYRKQFTWPKTLPNFYSAETFYAESSLKALSAVFDDERIQRFNYVFLTELLRRRFPRYEAKINQVREQFASHYSFERTISSLALAVLSIVQKRISWRRRIISSNRNWFQISGIKTCSESAQVLNKKLADSGTQILW
jgi:hypothetical protein